MKKFHEYVQERANLAENYTIDPIVQNLQQLLQSIGRLTYPQWQETYRNIEGEIKRAMRLGNLKDESVLNMIHQISSQYETNGATPQLSHTIQQTIAKLQQMKQSMPQKRNPFDDDDE